MKILGIDLGIASVGWGLIDFDTQNRENTKIISSGVRIFTKAEDPKTGASLASPRREARGRRKVLSRKRGRLKEVKRLFIEKLGLKSEMLYEMEDYGSGSIYREKNKIDVWKLRTEALDRKLTKEEMARVLTHIAKRRGYKSNKKTDVLEGESKQSKSGEVLKAIEENKEKMKKAGYLTVGEMIYKESLKESHPEKGKYVKSRNTTNDYRHVVTREMLKDEVEKIFDAQKTFSKDFDDALKKSYFEIAFYQRPLKSSENMVGNCTFEKDMLRAAKHSYNAERYVGLTEIIKMVMIDTKDRHREKRIIEFYPIEKIFEVFLNTKEVKYKTLRKSLSIPDTTQFKNVNYHANPEKDKSLPSFDSFAKKEVKLNQDQMNSLIYLDKDGNKFFHRRFKNYQHIREYLQLDSDFLFEGLKSEYKKNPEDNKIYSLNGYHTIKNKLDDEKLFQTLFKNTEVFDQIGFILTVEQDPEIIKKKLYETLENILDKENLNIVCDRLRSIRNFSGFNNLSLKAINRLIPHILQGKRYDEAAQIEYGHHSMVQGEKKKLLRKLNKEENYQITNPVVKRAFTQFRKLLNAIIKKYGTFDVLHIELAREMKHSHSDRMKIQSGQKEFLTNKESARNRFIELCQQNPSPKQLLKFRLWEEQLGKSIYSGAEINLEKLAYDEKAYEVEHILPYSRSFDNSLNNKVLALAKENQDKKNRTPFEWIGDKKQDSPSWQKFVSLVYSFKNIKPAKKGKLLNTTLSSRHGEDFDENDPESNYFINRNLQDTQYLARFIKNFVERNLEFKNNPEVKQKVKVRNGMVTSHLRYIWGLDGILQEIINPNQIDQENQDGEKKRNNHLHHALDALVIAATTQSEVQRLSTNAAKIEGYQYKNKEEKQKIQKLQSTSPFVIEELKENLKGIFPSFAPRRKVRGAAHEETLYSGKTFKMRKKTKEGKKLEQLKGSSFTYPVSLNHGKTLAKKDSMPRVDLFRHVETKKYYLVPIYVADFVKKKLPNEAIVSGKDKTGKPNPWLKMDENYEFITSIYKNDLIEVIRKDKTVRGYFDSAHSGNGNISLKNPIGDSGLIASDMGIQNAKLIKKFEISPLGEITEIKLPQIRVGTIHELRMIKKEKLEIKSKNNN